MKYIRTKDEVLSCSRNMNGKVRNVVYKKAITRIESFMSNNAHHYKQDIDFMKHLLEEKQELEQIIEKQELKQLKKENKELLTKLTKVCSAFYKSYNCLLGCEQYNLMSIKNNEYEKELYNIIDEVQNGKQ